MNRSKKGVLLVELLEPLDSLLTKRRRISRDRNLARLFDVWRSPVQGCDQLEELTRGIDRGYRHGFTWARRLSRRETFHTSPHFPHLQ